MMKREMFQAHPWHAIPLGDMFPKVFTCYIEIVPTDTVKYEIDKDSGLLKVDRPQKYSNYCPALYGFVPRTYCGQHVGDFCSQKIGREGIGGDEDPIDICVLADRPILRGNVLVKVRPIGGFRLIDRGEADDKIIAVLDGDFVYGDINDISECPENLIARLRHYFLTYKALPPEKNPVELATIYGREEACQILECAREDYVELFPEHTDPIG